MNVPLLIDAIVRQVTVLIAQLATSGGVRAPLAHIANQVFVELANELAEQGISRKVSADMFGMALRAYLRKVRRLNESSTERGLTLWNVVLEYVSERPRTRDEVIERFHRDDEAQLRAVLRDLVDSGLVFANGPSGSGLYRAADEAELQRLRQLSNAEGLAELVWVVIYREGPIASDLLARRMRMSPSELEAFTNDLVAQGRISKLDRDRSGLFAANSFNVPIGAQTGWEAAVLDHFQAAVQTIMQRLRGSSRSTRLDDAVGGSTYAFDVWPGHPLRDEVFTALKRFRETHSALRERVEQHNQDCEKPADYEQVIVYGGQYVLGRDGDIGKASQDD